MRKTALWMSLTALLFVTACGGLSPKGLDSANPQPPPPGSSPASSKVEANLAQLMRSIMFPNSNVIFAAQSANPADVKPAKDPSTALDPFQGAYGQWAAVENSGLAIAEAANLLMIPGRM